MAYAWMITNNATEYPIWITIYDLGKTTHLDWGWVGAAPPDPEPSPYQHPVVNRIWTAGNYLYGSLYYIRAEVVNANGSVIGDTTIQVYPTILTIDPPTYSDPSPILTQVGTWFGWTPWYREGPHRTLMSDEGELAASVGEYKRPDFRSEVQKIAELPHGTLRNLSAEEAAAVSSMRAGGGGTLPPQPSA
jgi:hypothetical protein